MFDIEHLIRKYDAKLLDLEQSLADLQKKFGESDGAMQSRFPTGRTELETQLKIIEDGIHDLKERILHLTGLKSKKTEMSERVLSESHVNLEINGEEGWFLLNERVSDFANGVISVETVLGKQLVNSEKGEKHVKHEDDSLLVVRIKDIIVLKS
jgi:transcription elongation GreA/GreB family factor